MKQRYSGQCFLNSIVSWKICYRIRLFSLQSDGPEWDSTATRKDLSLRLILCVPLTFYVQSKMRWGGAVPLKQWKSCTPVRVLSIPRMTQRPPPHTRKKPCLPPKKKKKKNNYLAPNWICVIPFLGQQRTPAAEGYWDMRCEYRRRPTHGKICREDGNNILQVFDQEKSCGYLEQLAAWKWRIYIRLITRRCGIWWFWLIDVDEDSLPAGK